MRELIFLNIINFGTGKTNRCEYLAHKIQKSEVVN